MKKVNIIILVIIVFFVSVLVTNYVNQRTIKKLKKDLYYCEQGIEYYESQEVKRLKE